MLRIGWRGRFVTNPAGHRGRGGRLLATVGVLVAAAGGAGALASSAMAKPPSPYRAADLVRIAHFAQEEGALLGVVLPGGSAHFVRLVESPLPDLKDPDGPADAQTSCVDADGRYEGKATSCTITIGTEAHVSAANIAAVVSHEVFHVFQAVMSGSLANFYRPVSAWLVEGSAAWVDSDLVSDDPSAGRFWAGYFAHPRVPLFSRAYSAIGFFAHVASSGVDLWKRFPAIFATTSNTAAYATATLGTTSAFLQNEASVFFREPAFGPAWDQEDQQDTKFANQNVASPGQVAFYDKPFKPQTITIGAATPPQTLTAVAYADRPVVLDPHLKSSDPFLNVSVLSGHARIHAADGEGNANAVDPVGMSFCAERDGCSCPGNPAKSSDVFLKGDLAITGGPTGGAVKLSSGPCALQPRSCINLLPTTDFTEIPATYDPATGIGATDGPLSEVLGPYPGECIVQYTSTAYLGAAPMSNAVFAGIYALNTFSSDADAHQALTTFVSNLGDQPVAGIGDEAYVGTSSGALRARNDVFDVVWLAPGMPPGVTVEGVLQNVAETLTQ